MQVDRLEYGIDGFDNRKNKKVHKLFGIFTQEMLF